MDSSPLPSNKNLEIIKTPHRVFKHTFLFLVILIGSGLVVELSSYRPFSSQLKEIGSWLGSRLVEVSSRVKLIQTV